MTKYVPIERHFRKVSDEAASPVLRSLRTRHRLTEPLTWSKILSGESVEPVVLLAPSGTGKSSEFEAQAARLRAEHEYAVYAEARALVDGFERGLDEINKNALHSCMSSPDRLVLFVDGVDELHLAHKTFRDLRRVLEAGFDWKFLRVRLVLCARNGTWTSEYTHDLQRLVQLKKEESVQLITFEPLDSNSIRKLAITYGVTDPDAFMRACDNEIAALFDLRPTDVRLLVNQWKLNPRFGHWSTLLSDFVSASFVEENTEHMRRRALPASEGRLALMRTAAACMFVGQPHVTTPGRPTVPGAVSSRQLFDDWPDPKVFEFFENPLLVHKGKEAEAVQLPQGVLSYFLAAQWIAERVRRGWPVAALRDTLLVRVFNESQYRIPKAYREGIGWVASAVPEFRELLMAEHPRVVLFEGDPDRLSDAEVGHALRTLCRALSRTRTEGFPAANVVKKLARPSLEADVLSMLKEHRRSSDALWHLLQFAELGGYTSCVPFALTVAQDTAVEGIARAAAIDVVGKARASIERLALLKLLDESDKYVRTALLRATLPDLLQGEALVRFLVAGGDYYFRHFLRQRLPELSLEDIEATLASLQGDMATGRVSSVTESKLAVTIPLLTEWLSRKASVRQVIVEVLAGVEQLLAGHAIYVDTEDREALDAGLASHSGARRDLWQLRLKRSQASPSSFQYVMSPEFGAPQAADLDWMWSLEETYPDLRWVTDSVLSRLDPPAREEKLATAPKAVRRRARAREEDQNQAKETQRKHQLKEQRRLDRSRQQNQDIVNQARSAIESGDDINKLVWAWDKIISRDSNHELDFTRLESAVGQDHVEIFRRGFEACWRKQAVELPAPGNTTIFIRYDAGLVGLALEARSGLDFSTLSAAEAQLACRYALYALNRLPFWFDDLIQAHGAEVRQVLRRTIADHWWFDGEHTGILRLASYGQEGAASLIREIALEFLELANPHSLQVLRDAVDLLLTSSESHTRVVELARLRALQSGTAPNMRVQWLRLWAHFAPIPALDWTTTSVLDSTLCTETVLRTAASLEVDIEGRYGRRVATSLNEPRALAAWASLLLRLARPGDDIQHHGVYSPGVKDNAQSFRDRCLRQIAANPSLEARRILLELADAPELESETKLLFNLIERQCVVAADAAVVRWSESDILAMENGDEKQPRSLEELCSLVRRHLAQMHEMIANSDFSYRNVFSRETKEREIQLWVAASLQQQARSLYNVVRENVVDLDKRIDISAHCPGLGHVPVEIKPLGPYTLESLKSTLEDQLLGQYMAPADRHYGILLLVRRDKRRWRVGREQVNLGGLVNALRASAYEIGLANGRVIHVEVIDLLEQPGTSQAV